MRSHQAASRYYLDVPENRATRDLTAVEEDARVEWPTRAESACEVQAMSRSNYGHPGLHAKGNFPWDPNVAVRSPAGRLDLENQGPRLFHEQPPDGFG